MSRWAALFFSLTADNGDSDDIGLDRHSDKPAIVTKVTIVNDRGSGKRGTDEPRLAATQARDGQAALVAALAEAAARGAHAAVSEPTDPEEAAFAKAEREAIQAEDEAAAGDGRACAARARMAEPPETRPLRARGPSDWPELTSLSPGVYAAFTSLPDGSVEVRHRRPDGTWSEPTVLPAARARSGEAA